MGNQSFRGTAKCLECVESFFFDTVFHIAREVVVGLSEKFSFPFGKCHAFPCDNGEYSVVCVHYENYFRVGKAGKVGLLGGGAVEGFGGS